MFLSKKSLLLISIFVLGCLAIAGFLNLTLAMSLPDGPTRAGCYLAGTCFLIEASLLGFVIVLWRQDSKTATLTVDKDLDPISRTTSMYVLVGLTLIAALLRLLGLNSSLWHDELITVSLSNESLNDLLFTWLGEVNHLLNTLLVKASTSVFGESNWAVRLPAATFGIATVPVAYGLARHDLPRLPSLIVAGLIATSYHHVFISQNARGYSAFFFFTLLTTWLFLRAIRYNRFSDWGMFSFFTVFNFAAQLFALTVALGQAIVGLVYILQVQRGYRWNVFSRMALAFSVAAILVIHMYSFQIPLMAIESSDPNVVAANQVAEVEGEVLQQPTSGLSDRVKSLFQTAFPIIISEFGIGGLVTLILLALTMGSGMLYLLWLNWKLIFSLVLPSFVILGLVTVTGMSFLPRYFVMWIAIAILSVGGAICALRKSGLSDRWKISASLILPILFLSLSLRAFPRYYERPKQDFSGAVSYLCDRMAVEDYVVTIATSDFGMRYYWKRLCLNVEEPIAVEDIESLEQIVAQWGSENGWLVTTFPSGSAGEWPLLFERIERDWQVEHQFEGLNSEMQITLWRYKQRL